MSERRIDDLLRYLDTLTRLKAQGEYLCGKEITECITEIRRELIDLEQPPQMPITTSRPGYVTIYDLRDVPTAQLTDELAKREGVAEYGVDPYQSAEVTFDIEGMPTLDVRGPARILVNTEGLTNNRVGSLFIYRRETNEAS